MVERYPDLETRKKVCGSLKAKHEAKDLQEPKQIVNKINLLRSKHPNENLRTILNKAFTSDFNTQKQFVGNVRNLTLDFLASETLEDKRWVTINGRRIQISTKKGVVEKAKLLEKKPIANLKNYASMTKAQVVKLLEKCKAGIKDFTEDAKSKTPSGNKPKYAAGSMTAKAKGSRTTTTGQALKKAGIEVGSTRKIEPIGPDQFAVPFEIYNSETGEIILGERFENTLGTERQMQPVASSNVKAVGQLNNKLLVQFLNSQGTYQYNFADPTVAGEAFEGLSNSSSPGRWIWHNIRGHSAGEPIPPTKIGPSLVNRVPTIGGTTASLVQYELLGRTPVGRVPGFNKMSKLAQRETSNPSLNPNVGVNKPEESRLEGLLGARKGFRELGLKIQQDMKKWLKRKTMDTKKVGYTRTYVGNLFELTRDNEEEPEDLQSDFIELSTFTPQTLDFNGSDFTVLEGVITRSGAFDYSTNGQKKILYKEWPNIKERFSEIDYLPLRGTTDVGSHHAQEIGFVYNFRPDDRKEQMRGTIVLLDDIQNITDLIKPANGYHVSIGFEDDVIGDRQIIKELDHLAISLSNKEKGRCSSAGGTDCTFKEPDHDQNLTEVVA